MSASKIDKLPSNQLLFQKCAPKTTLKLKDIVLANKDALCKGVNGNIVTRKELRSTDSALLYEHLQSIPKSEAESYLDYNLIPNNETQSKIDILITPYNKSKIAYKYMNF